MCGIAGILGSHAGDLQSSIRLMVGALRARGPDDSGTWLDAAVPLGLGHARLSILDLTAEGRQPMVSSTGRYVITYNGEVYNFEELRRELGRAGCAFRGHSDTEAMLAAFEHWGVEAAIHRFVGMFAFALWDREARILHLVRDRVGIKPLYFGWAGPTFLFGSELKAFRACPGFAADINREALPLYLRLNCIPAPFSIYRNVYKLPPGCMLAVPAASAARPEAFSPDPDDPHAAWKPVRYWSARTVAEKGAAGPREDSVPEAMRRLEGLLKDVVRDHMVADVSLGAFLSGGVDSSIVVALMQAQSGRPVKTFTIGFQEAAFDEAEQARAVARHLGTDHTELYATPAEALAVIPRVPAIFDEPFADSSQLPTILLSQLTRRHVTVCLSGDGGDELFAGYNRHAWCARLWKRLRWLPRGLRRLAAQGLTAGSPRAWESVFQALGPLLPDRARQRTPGYKLHKLAEVLDADGPDDMYLRLISHWKDHPSPVVDAHEPPTVVTDRARWADLEDFTERMLFLDTVAYLPDDLLVKLDRASMGVGLEARVPLLDHRLVEFAWRVPLSMKLRDGAGKWLLRQVLYKYVPQALIDRPKMGFAVPLDVWLRGPLREWADSLLDERRLREEGFFHPGPIRAKWAQHLSGRRDWQYDLWDILMFQAWLDEHKPAAFR